MASSIKFQSSEYFGRKIHKRAADIFEAKTGKPQLQVHRQFRTARAGHAKRIKSLESQDVGDISQLQALEKADDISQIFIIQQPRSWETLNISRELLEDFTRVYSIYTQFWRIVFTFGNKYQENEFEFPGFRSLRTSCNPFREVKESTYVLRRVELHGRKLTEGQSPWSIRQTAIYHRCTHDSDPSASSTNSKSVFLFIAPSRSIEGQLPQAEESDASNELAESPWNLHRLLVAESLEGWMDYMAWLEREIKEQSNRIVASQVGDEEDEDFPSLTELGIDITDRQNLKLVDDSVRDLQIILSTMLSTIARICKECRYSCEKYHSPGRCDCKPIIEEFDEYVHEVEMYVERAKALREGVKSTIKLLTDLLSYESQAALKDISRQSREETKSMHALAERSTNDAGAVKILTIISLIYLPTAIVLNFFSTQFVRSTDRGEMEISSQVWLLAAVAFPLTALTLGIWLAWKRETEKRPGTLAVGPVPPTATAFQKSAPETIRLVAT